MIAGSIKLPTEERAQDVGKGGKTLTESTVGGVRRTSGRQGGARFTGASASLKAVWGESARGTADTPTAATNSNRISIQYASFMNFPVVNIAVKMPIVNDALGRGWARYSKERMAVKALLGRLFGFAGGGARTTRGSIQRQDHPIHTGGIRLGFAVAFADREAAKVGAGDCAVAFGWQGFRVEGGEG